MIRLNNKGFSVTELVIALGVATLLSAMFFTIFVTFYGSTLRSEAESRLVVDSQIILRNIVDELREASEIRLNNLNADANQPTGGWATDSNNAILIIAKPAEDSDGDYIFDDLTGNPYMNEIIYFAEGDTLYRRTVPDTNAVGNIQGPTCPEDLSSDSCLPDRDLTESYQDMEFVFYDQDDTLTTDTALARSVDITIEMGREIFGSPVEIDNNIRITLRN